MTPAVGFLGTTLPDREHRALMDFHVVLPSPLPTHSKQTPGIPEHEVIKRKRSEKKKEKIILALYFEFGGCDFVSIVFFVPKQFCPRGVNLF